MDKVLVEEWEVTAAVIDWARKTTHVRDKGDFAEAVVKKARKMPEFTHASFMMRYLALSLIAKR